MLFHIPYLVIFDVVSDHLFFDFAAAVLLHVSAVPDALLLHQRPWGLQVESLWLARQSDNVSAGLAHLLTHWNVQTVGQIGLRQTEGLHGRHNATSRVKAELVAICAAHPLCEDRREPREPCEKAHCAAGPEPKGF